MDRIKTFGDGSLNEKDILRAEQEQVEPEPDNSASILRHILKLRRKERRELINKAAGLLTGAASDAVDLLKKLKWKSTWKALLRDKRLSKNERNLLEKTATDLDDEDVEPVVEQLENEKRQEIYEYLGQELADPDIPLAEKNELIARAKNALKSIGESNDTPEAYVEDIEVEKHETLIWHPNGKDAFLRRQDVTVASGAGSTGKTTVMTTLAKKAAGGKTKAIFKVRKKTKSLIATFEDPASEIAAIGGQCPKEMLLVKDFMASGMFLIGKESAFKEAHRGEAAAILEELIKEHDIDLLIIDNLANCVKNLNINESGDMMEVMKLLYEFARKLDIGVILIHHSTKDPKLSPCDRRQVRGSALLTDRPRSVVSFSWQSNTIKDEKTSKVTGHTKRVRVVSILKANKAGDESNPGDGICCAYKITGEAGGDASGVQLIGEWKDESELEEVVNAGLSELGEETTEKSSSSGVDRSEYDANAAEAMKNKKKENWEGEAVDYKEVDDYDGS